MVSFKLGIQTGPRDANLNNSNFWTWLGDFAFSPLFPGAQDRTVPELWGSWTHLCALAPGWILFTVLSEVPCPSLHLSTGVFGMYSLCLCALSVGLSTLACTVWAVPIRGIPQSQFMLSPPLLRPKQWVVMSECGWEGTVDPFWVYLSLFSVPFLYSLGTSCACTLGKASHWVMAAVSCVSLFPTLDRELQDKSHAFLHLPLSSLPPRVPGTEVCLVNRCWRDEGRKVHVLYS